MAVARFEDGQSLFKLTPPERRSAGDWRPSPLLYNFIA